MWNEDSQQQASDCLVNNANHATPDLDRIDCYSLTTYDNFSMLSGQEQLQHHQHQQGSFVLSPTNAYGSVGQLAPDYHQSQPPLNLSINSNWIHQAASSNSQQQQSLQGISEREFIIVRRNNLSVWGGQNTIEYECRVCGRRCRWRSSITVHVRTHTGRRPYDCRVCHQSFADSSTRKKHEKKTHNREFPGGKAKPVTADFQDLLQQQQQQQQQQQIVQQVCKCRFCFASLGSESDLAKHLFEFHNQTVPQFSEAFAGHLIHGSPTQHQEANGGVLNLGLQQQQQQEHHEQEQEQQQREQYDQQLMIEIPLPAASIDDSDIGGYPDALLMAPLDGDDSSSPEFGTGQLVTAQLIDGVLEEEGGGMGLMMSRYGQHLELDELGW